MAEPFTGSFGGPFRVKSLSEWSKRDSLAEHAIKEIREAADRSAVIVAAAFVEDYLKDAIKAVAQKDEKLFNEIIAPDGILGSFGAKIKIGFLLNLYDEILRKELEEISKIRNKFAHKRDVRSFQNNEIRDRVNKLTAGENINITITIISRS